MLEILVLVLPLGKLFSCLKLLRFSTEPSFLRDFSKWVFRFSGFDWFTLFERVLQLDTEFIETFGGDTFSLLDNEYET